MAALHKALQALGPIEYSSLDLDNLEPTLRDAFAKSQLLIESVPLPEDAASPATGRSRANTTSSSASNASEISSSAARSTAPHPDHASLQKEWGKPIRLSAKENPLGISVYKLSGKDGRGAWFARRSVHEGLGFTKWKRGLEREFPESLEVQGGPGEGNVRGIGGERIVESKTVNGVGRIQVYHLSAQFPGPTTPRDFVTLLLTSASAIGQHKPSSSTTSLPSLATDEPPRHYVVVSRPCVHLDCPPREGFIRGEYESIEFIREVPVKKVAAGGRRRSKSTSEAREAVVRNARKSQTFPVSGGLDGAKENTPPEGPPDDQIKSAETRTRGKTISFDAAPDRQSEAADGEADEESNSVEWIMITRSDPGGSVPRWMVERGTPAGIVSDATKFLDWACQKEHPPEDDIPEEDETAVKKEVGNESHPPSTNGQTGESDDSRPPAADSSTPPSAPEAPPAASGILSSVTQAVTAVTPTIISSRLPGASTSTSTTSNHQPTPSTTTVEPPTPSSASISTTSLDSFATASSGNCSPATPSSKPASTKESPQDKALQALTHRLTRLDAALSKTRQAISSNHTSLSARESAALQKAEDKHQREVKKGEEKYKKEVEKIEKRREKEQAKEQARQRKEREKDERARWKKEVDGLRREVEALRGERDELKRLVGDVQGENTRLVMEVGRGRTEEGGVGAAGVAG